MKLSLQERILRYLKSHSGVWIHKERLAEAAKEKGFMAETAYRSLRALAEEGKIQKREVKGHKVKSVEYRYAA